MDLCHNFDLLMRFILTSLILVFFNNGRLTTVRLVQFKSKHFKLVARCLTQRKNKKSFGNNRKNVQLHSQSQCFFANVSLIFSNSNNRQMTFTHSRNTFVFCAAGCRVSCGTEKKDYSCSLGYKQPITSKKIMTSPRRNELYQRPKAS